MKKFLRWAIAVVGALLIVAVIAVLGRDVVLKGMAQRRIQQRTGLRAEIGVLETGLRSTSILLRDVKLYNRPDFGGSLLLEVPECFIEMDSFLAQGKLHFKQLRLNLAQLNVIRDKAGRFNLEQVEHEYRERDPAKARTNPPGAKIQFAGIDRMLLTIGKIKFTDLQKPSRSREIDVGLKDELVTHIKTEEDLQEWVGSQLFRLIVQEVAKPDRKGRGRNVQLLLEPFREEATPSP